MSERENRESLLLPLLLPVGALAIIGLVLFGFSRVLLDITPSAATVVALITATGVVAVASIVASRKRLTGSALFPMIGTIFGIALLSGGVAIVAAGPGGGEEPEPVTVALAAPVGAAVEGFSTDTLTFQADTPTNLEFDNQDTGASHNVEIFQGEDANAPVAFTGALTVGPATITYSVPPLGAGSFFFHCEVHPDTMTGTVDVKSAPPGGGPAPSGPSITAANLAFDTAELDLPAEVPTTLTFVNDDPGTQHNVSVYGDASFATNLFTGELVSGPATLEYQLPAFDPGTYYFKCDVHPTMAGTVVVAAAPEGAGGEGGAGPGDGATPSGGETASPGP